MSCRYYNTLVISRIRDHRYLTMVLLIALALYLLFPLQLQSLEPYNYAAAIERYYKDSVGFSLSQGEYIPDFGRYHPNHPIGHAIAGLAFDWFSIPALTWIKIVNTIAALASGIFFYMWLLQLRCSRAVATVSVALSMATHGGLFTVFSGEWHLPAVALSLAGMWQISIYIEEGIKRYLYRATLLFGIATCYHLAAFFYLFPLGIVLLFLRPLNERWREFTIAAMGLFLLLLIVYIIVPFIIFRFHSLEEFSRTFFVYSRLSHIRYGGLDWLLITARTIFQTVMFTPVSIRSANVFMVIFFLLFAIAAWRFSRGNIARPMRIIVLSIPGWWVFCHWLLGARPDSLIGWFFILPFVSLIIVKALSDMHRLAIRILVAFPLLLLGWNLWLAILPNSLQKRENIFFFNLPPGTSSTIPVAFVENTPVFTDPEIWYAGSELGFRNQMHFFPCCGENNYYSRLKHWIRKNPGFVLVSDGSESALDNLLRSEGLNYVRWLDRRARWPLSLVPSTLYVQHIASPWNEKKLVVWVPEDLLRYR